jgi:maleate isomerase
MTPIGPLIDLSGMARFDLADDTRRVGLIAPFDFALDDEYWRWLGAGQTLCTARTPYYEHPVSVQMAKAVRNTADLVAAARSLAMVRPSATVYACTSASFVGGMAGERTLRDVMAGAGLPNAVTTSGALVEALESLRIRRVAIGSPYNAELTRLLAHFLTEAGYEVVGGAFLGLDADIARVDSRSVYELARATDTLDADAVFLSCTNLRAFDVLGAAEHDLGKPVLSANQVSVWAALRAAGLPSALVDQMLFTGYRPRLVAQVPVPSDATISAIRASPTISPDPVIAADPVIPPVSAITPIAADPAISAISGIAPIAADPAISAITTLPAAGPDPALAEPAPPIAAVS